jgi:hypothetical protein
VVSDSKEAANTVLLVLGCRLIGLVQESMGNNVQAEKHEFSYLQKSQSLCTTHYLASEYYLPSRLEVGIMTAKFEARLVPRL